MPNTVLLVASGPSANQRDVDILASTGCRVVCVNNAWELYPNCECVYAGDEWWWNTYGASVPDTAHKVWAGRGRNLYGCEYDGPLNGKWHSGLKALEYVLRSGADEVMLIGFDCCVSGNALHFHENHKGPNPRTENLEQWVSSYAEIPLMWPYARILNLSPISQIPDFPKVSVAQAVDIFRLKVNSKNLLGVLEPT